MSNDGGRLQGQPADGPRVLVVDDEPNITELLGMAPMQYLTHWRIQAAGYDLLNTKKSIHQVAQEVGYESEAAFTRAFKRTMGAPPAAWRRQRR